MDELKARALHATALPSCCAPCVIPLDDGRGETRSHWEQPTRDWI